MKKSGSKLKNVDLNFDRENCGDLLSYIAIAKEKEEDICGLLIQDVQLENQDLSKLCFRDIIFQDCL
ncbi:MAG: hypothetical protein RR396_06400, partial [Clostridiales bacterium]